MIKDYTLKDRIFEVHEVLIDPKTKIRSKGRELGYIKILPKTWKRICTIRHKRILAWIKKNKEKKIGILNSIPNIYKNTTKSTGTQKIV